MDTTLDTVLPGTRFQIFSGLLKTSRSADGKMRLHGVASSTTKDLHGDTMESTALEDMERAANNNLTIFLNHSYEVPEDVAGSVERAQMKTRGADQVGNPNYDLDMDILINDANPRAVKAFEAIEKGTKLGLSIGALIPDGGAVRDKKSGSYLIQHVDLLETSLVGIPANPRSWVEYAAKSLRGLDATKDATTVPIGSPTLTLDGKNYKIEGSIEGLTLANSTTTNAAATVTTVDATVFGDTQSTTLLGTAVIDDATPDVDKAMCPTCGKGKSADDDCADPYHKSVEPDVTDATVTVIQIDTGNGSSESDSDSSGDAPASQGGQATEPDSGDGDYAASGADAVTTPSTPQFDGPVQDAVGQLVGLLRSTTGELVELRRQLSEAQTGLDTVTRERDTAVSERDHVLTETKRVLDRLADTPLVRRAAVVDAEKELRQKFSGVYSEDFLKLIS